MNVEAACFERVSPRLRPEQICLLDYAFPRLVDFLDDSLAIVRGFVEMDCSNAVSSALILCVMVASKLVETDFFNVMSNAAL